MILHRSLALPRSVLNSTLSNTESTQRKQVFPRWKFTERSRKGILYGYLEDNASWSRLSRARTCSGLITDTKLKPLATRVSMSQILFFSLRFSIFVFQFLSPSFSTESHALASKRSEFQRRNFPIFNRNVVCSIDTFWYGLRLQLWN